MSLFVGLDVSQRLTHLCVVDADGKRVWRGKCATDPTILAETIRTQAGSDARVGLEPGPLHEMRAGPSKPTIRRRLQTPASCDRKERSW
ncbi:MAG: hypothetical protein DCF16_18410 [Alphaproteobacteria bacterium]|nr:MAG: hypothetical protein DCF16_18410 [Alphaproteobacteria bacterium]